MPTIYRPKKKREKRDYLKQLDNANRVFAANLYHSLGWKRLRISKLVANQLCERCEKMGIITLANEVHHIKKFMSGINEGEKALLFYQFDNLMSVCPECHKILDNNKEFKEY
jgi:5-methylcytosine-specific restriction enzyme A